MVKLLIGFAALTCTSAPAMASDLEDLAKQGYAVVAETQVKDEFEGCDFDKRIAFENGLIFICETYSYSYAYRPDVLILKHVRTGDLKVIIDDNEYDGRLVQAR